MAVNLDSLPAPRVIESLDYESILAERKAFFISLHPADQQADVAAMLELESEPIVKMLQENALRELLLRARVNDGAKAVLLAFSTGSDLDHVAATYYREERLIVTPANPDADPPVAEVKEADSDFKYRCSLKPESYSVAGPTQAYEFHALSASGQVKSSKVDSPRPGTTRVYVLSRTGNGVPTVELLDTVEAALSGDDVRPLSEEVIVEPASVIEYSIDYRLTMYPGAASESALNASRQALEALALSAHQLDYDLTLSQLDGAAQKAGIKRAVRMQPTEEIVCGKGEAPYCTGITVTIVGIEE